MINFFLRQAVILIICCALLCFAVLPSSILIAKENKREKNLPNPNWVHPGNRSAYPGYAIHNQRKQTSPDWQYATNRERGNIRGGGTTEYNDYTPFYEPDKPKKAK